MQSHPLYEFLGRFSLAATLLASVLALAAIVLSQPASAGAAALCAGTFGIPGILFLLEARHGRTREAALLHIEGLVREKGLADAGGLAAELGISRENAEKILQRAIREGYLAGSPESGRLLPADR